MNTANLKIVLNGLAMIEHVDDKQNLDYWLFLNLRISVVGLSVVFPTTGSGTFSRSLTSE